MSCCPADRSATSARPCGRPSLPRRDRESCSATPSPLPAEWPGQTTKPTPSRIRPGRTGTGLSTLPPVSWSWSSDFARAKCSVCTAALTLCAPSSNASGRPPAQPGGQQARVHHPLRHADRAAVLQPLLRHAKREGRRSEDHNQRRPTHLRPTPGGSRRCVVGWRCKFCATPISRSRWSSTRSPRRQRLSPLPAQAPRRQPRQPAVAALHSYTNGKSQSDRLGQGL
jgi:hypothetical protein